MSGVSVGITLTGVDEVLGRLSERQAVAMPALVLALTRFALLIERIAKDDYVPVITGRLRASIGGQSAPPPQRPDDAVFRKVVAGDAVEIFMGSNVIYAPIIEFGRRPGGHHGGGRRAGAEYAADVRKTTGKGRPIGNGRHGPFMRPAIDRARSEGFPVLREQLKTALGLA